MEFLLFLLYPVISRIAKKTDQIDVNAIRYKVLILVDVLSTERLQFARPISFFLMGCKKV